MVARQRDSAVAVPEQECDEIRALRALALAGATGLRTAAQWKTFLRRAERTPEHGFVNIMLIWAQRPDVIQLRSYQEWRLARRQVHRGAQAVRVIAHREGHERIGSLFDLMQTEGDPVPVEFPLTGSRAAVSPQVWHELAALALRENVFVPGTDAAGADAWFDWALRVKGEDAVMAAAVNLCGRVAGHLVRGTASPFGEFGQGVEAESTAFLLALRLGLDVSRFAFPSVTSWAGTDERAMPGERVLAMGQRVLDAAQRAFACVGTDHATVTRLVAGPRLPKPVRLVVQDSEAVRVQLAVARFFAAQRQGSWVPGYLTGRGFSEAVQQRWGIGYVPASWTALVSHLRELGHGEDVLEESALAKRAANGTLISVFRDRAMFPVRSAGGTVLGFTGRARDGAPKYLNSKQTSLYRKGEVLFGLCEGRQALADGARTVIVERPLDAIAVTEASGGRYVGVAPCGTALTASQAGLLSAVVVAFDGDEAGQRAAVRAWDLLGDRAGESSVADFPAGHDPASLMLSQGSDGLLKVLDENQRPLADVAIDAILAKYERWLQFTEGVFNALNAVAPLLAQLPASQVTRQSTGSPATSA